MKVEEIADFGFRIANSKGRTAFQSAIRNPKSAMKPMRHFHEQLDDLFQRLVLMGSITEGMIRTAVLVLTEQDESLAAEVYAREQEVNTLQVEVDDKCVRLTSLQQPVAQDARFLFMASRIGGELERIADLTVNICQNTHHVLEGPPIKPMVDLTIMCELVQKMVRDSVTAMVNRDPSMADAVFDEEEKVDAFRDQVFACCSRT